ncbi:MAG: response regulator [Firmicutes bacterium]|nr:response regulator [Bacillota bacterium]
MYKKKSILIVDDTKFYSDMLYDFLFEEYNINIVSDGEAALSTIKFDIPDLIILDVLMPGMDGFEVCNILKQNKKTKDIPIIILSSLTNVVDESKGLELGAIDYIKKPFNLKLLKNRIENHLELYEKMGKLTKELVESNNIVNKEIENIIKSLGILATYRDDDTGKHLERTKFYMRFLADELKNKYPYELNENKIDLLCQSSILHDIGKVGISDSILLKKGKLTNSEFEEIKKHTIKGRDIIREVEVSYGKSEFLNIAAEIAEYHHEKWDGSGYPYGLIKQQIPFYARMMSIIDIYDALTSERPYKNAFTHEEAIKIILEGDDRVKPQHFDPDILEAFNRIHIKFKDFSLVEEFNLIKN